MDQDYTIAAPDEFASQMGDNAVFENLILTGADLSQSAAAGLTIKHCKFIDVDLSDVDWEKLTCLATTWVNCRFTGAKLSGAVFENCSFFDPSLAVGCSFVQSNLRAAVFKKCDLSSCLFEGADLFRLVLQDSNAVGTKFFRAKLNNSVKITRTNLKYADLRGANLAKCDLSENNFVFAVLDEGDFSKSNLLGSDLGGATTKYAKFTQADLRGANLSSFDIRTVDVRGAKILESQMRRLLENCEMIIFPDNS